MLLSGRARLAGVMGWPVGHSLSPLLHGHWLERYGIDGAYVPLPVRPEDLALAFRALPRLGFLGWNVTLPHKEAAFGLVDRHDEAAGRMGAVNTVLVHADGGLEGRNTDGYGFLSNLALQAPAWQAAAGPALVLGAGGAARAVAVALLEAGVPVLRLANRTSARAQALAQELGRRARGRVETVSWPVPAAALADAILCVNATSLGMKGQPALALELEPLPPGAVVADLVYVPLDTPFLQAARRLGHVTVDGLGMLIHQAVPGFTHWGGCRPEPDEATRALLLAALTAR